MPVCKSTQHSKLSTVEVKKCYNLDNSFLPKIKNYFKGKYPDPKIKLTSEIAIWFVKK